MNELAKVVHHLRHGRNAGWQPLLAVYYLTYRCDFRCPYCSDGHKKPYWAQPERTPTAEQALAILATMRRWCDRLVVTGGEPLQHPEVDRVLEGLARLRFKDVVLTTNGYALDEHLPALAAAVDHLVFSLDTFDAAKADRWYGLGDGTLARVLEQIERAATAPQRRYQIVISGVVTPENIPDLEAVFAWSQERGYRFAACPQLVGVEPHPALRGNDAYRRLFDLLIHEKKRGARVEGTVRYLEQMRDLPRFVCRPLTMISVAPLGEVFYPCLELARVAGNALEEPDLAKLHASAQARFGPLPTCGNQCHSACALGFATVFDHPSAALHEGWLEATARLRRR